MMTEILAVSLATLGLVSLWFLLSVEYHHYHVDRTRLRLFKIRDELFDQAARDRIPFAAKAYGMTRLTLNGMINLTHEIALVRLILLAGVYLTRDVGDLIGAFEKKLDRSIAELPDSQAEMIRDALGRAHIVLFSHVLNTSLAVLFFGPPVAVLMETVRACQRIKRSVLKRVSRLKAWAAVDVEANYLMGKVHTA